MVCNDAPRQPLPEGMTDEVNSIPTMLVEDAYDELSNLMKCGTFGHLGGRVECVCLETSGTQFCD